MRLRGLNLSDTFTLISDHPICFLTVTIILNLQILILYKRLGRLQKAVLLHGRVFSALRQEMNVECSGITEPGMSNLL
jgi:hypothetical protein